MAQYQHNPGPYYTCPHCGFAQNPAQAKFCGSCGRPMQASSRPDPIPPYRPVRPEPSPQTTTELPNFGRAAGEFKNAFSALSKEVRLTVKNTGQSTRERLVWAGIIGFLFNFFVCGPVVTGMVMVSGFISSISGANDRSLGFAVVIWWLVIFFILMGIFYYLFGYSERWRATNDMSYVLLDNMGAQTPDIYNRVLERMKRRQLPAPYITEFRNVSERDIFAFTGSITKTQLFITSAKARVVLRIFQYGTDLYVRWDSFVDFSARRFWIIMSWLTPIMFIYIALASWISPNSLFAVFAVPDISNWGRLPSYVVDNLLALEEAAAHSIEEVLNAIIQESGGDERVEMPIDRTQRNYRRGF